ncbi:hypothetical protein HY546_00825 [archaeon]|nr:hypothetical protein [archaeon]
MDRKKILITRSSDDHPTGVLFYFAGSLIEKLKDVGEYIIVDLSEEKATRTNFEKTIQKTNPRLVILNGHGNEREVCGYRSETILDDTNIKLLDSKIVYAVACDSAEELGDLSVQIGKADAYIGYDANFMVVCDPSRTTVPSKDKNIKPFEKVYYTLVLSLVSGFSVYNSVEKTKDITKQLIKDYGVSAIKDKYGDAPLIRFALYWNFCYLKYYGDNEAVI